MKKEIKIGIVGMGRVGAAIAYNIGIKNIADVIYAIDTNETLAQVQVDDLQASFIIEDSKTKICTNNYEDMDSVDILIITAGVPTTLNRLDSYEQNYKIMTSVVKNAKDNGFNGFYLVASNPVDVMTSVIQKESSFPHNKVIGTGTILDNARFKYEIGNKLNINYKNIRSNCIGEHGQSIVPLYSQVKVNEQILKDYLIDNELKLDYNEITQNVINGGPKIFTVKGATEFGIASGTAKIVNAIINNTNEELLVTSLIHVDKIGELYIPVLSSVNKQGAKSKTLSNISQSEYNKFYNSAKILSKYQKRT